MEHVEDSASESGRAKSASRKSLEAIPAELKHAVQEGKRLSVLGTKKLGSEAAARAVATKGVARAAGSEAAARAVATKGVARAVGSEAVARAAATKGVAKAVGSEAETLSRKMSDRLLKAQMSELEAEFLEEETMMPTGAEATSWNKKCNLLHPQSGLRRVWDLGILGLMLWIAIAEPLRMALLWVHAEWSSYDTLLTAWLLLDVVANLCTGIVVNRRLIRHPKEVAASYLRGGGPLDVLVALPWTQITGYPRTSPCIRLLKLLRLTNIHNSLYSNWVRYLSVRYGIRSIAITSLHFFFLLFVISHWAACLFIYLGKGPYWQKNDDSQSEFTQITWLSVLEADPDMQSPDPERWGQLYVTALYFSITTMSTIGYGDISPKNMWERVAALILMIIGNASRRRPLPHTANRAPRAVRAHPPARPSANRLTARTFRRPSSLTASPASSMRWPTRTKR